MKLVKKAGRSDALLFYTFFESCMIELHERTA